MSKQVHESVPEANTLASPADNRFERTSSHILHSINITKSKVVKHAQDFCKVHYNSRSRSSLDEETNQEPLGTFKDDFIRLCQERNIPYIPAIVLRPKPPNMMMAQMPVLEKPRTEKKNKRSTRIKAKLSDLKHLTVGSKSPTQPKSRMGSISEDDVRSFISRSPSVILPELREPQGMMFPLTEEEVVQLPPTAEISGSVEEPSTYTTKDSADYFKPCIQVEQEPVDDDKMMTAVYIRSWKVDMLMMEVLQDYLPRQYLLRSILMWNVNLAADTLHILASFVPMCTRLTSLTLDANTLAGTRVEQLLQDCISLKHLSLRFCGLTDSEAEGIGAYLPSANMPLVTLNLSNNKIGDRGAGHIADGLKLNRTLLVLNLSCNQLGNEGAMRFSEAFSQFPLTPKQMEERKNIFMIRASEKENISPIRPVLGKKHKGSSPVVSLSSREMLEKKSEGPKRQRDSKKQKESKSASKRQKSEKLELSVKTSSDESRSPKMSPADSRFKPYRARRNSLPQSKIVSDEKVYVSPLTDVCCSFQDGKLWLPGNRTLISLNLSRNQIGKIGFKALLEAVEEQLKPIHGGQQVTPGLRRLVIHRNRVADTDEVIMKINRIMRLKDPLFKSPSVNLDKCNITPCSIPILK